MVNNKNYIVCSHVFPVSYIAFTHRDYPVSRAFIARDSSFRTGYPIQVIRLFEQLKVSKALLPLLRFFIKSS